MKILLLSAYDAASHRRWHQGLIQAFPEYTWTLLTLPPRYFSWRVRGNSLSWAWQQRDVLESDYDLLIATSMVDLSSLRGFVPKLSACPTLLYFHENQFTYPVGHRSVEHGRVDSVSVEPQVLSLYSALCADALVFNTDYNRQTFMDGAAALLKRLPDHVPVGLVAELQDKTSVIAVPIDGSCFRDSDSSGDSQSSKSASSLWTLPAGSEGNAPVKILWAARWEYDKGPALLLAILRELKARNYDFQLCLLGQSFRQSPDEFATIQSEFAHVLVQVGHEPSGQRYRAWLASADIVLSTALHEFQGLAVLEAIAAGCVPVLPGRLSYPELVPEQYLYDGVNQDLQIQARSAADLIQSALMARPAPNVSRFGWPLLREEYGQLLQRLMS